jgi:cbb3-type cytochrome oxidase maturation protein
MRCERGGSRCARLDVRLAIRMDSLYLLIPLSIVLVLAIGAVLVWSVMSGQFDDLDAEGRRIIDEDRNK